MSPNPTSGETILSIESTSETLKSASANAWGFDDNAEWDMEVYSPGQTLKTKKTKLKGKSTTIQTAGWMEGVYTALADKAKITNLRRQRANGMYLCSMVGHPPLIGGSESAGPGWRGFRSAHLNLKC